MMCKGRKWTCLEIILTGRPAEKRHLLLTFEEPSHRSKNLCQIKMWLCVLGNLKSVQNFVMRHLFENSRHYPMTTLFPHFSLHFTLPKISWSCKYLCKGMKHTFSRFLLDNEVTTIVAVLALDQENDNVHRNESVVNWKKWKNVELWKFWEKTSTNKCFW